MKAIKCDCRHSYQDRVYGEGVRAHNHCPGHPDAKAGGWRCTVCTKEKPANAPGKDIGVR